MVYPLTFVGLISLHQALEGSGCIVKPFHSIHKTEQTTQEKWQVGKDGLHGQQEKAMMSTAAKKHLILLLNLVRGKVIIVPF